MTQGEPTKDLECNTDSDVWTILDAEFMSDWRQKGLLERYIWVARMLDSIPRAIQKAMLQPIEKARDEASTSLSEVPQVTDLSRLLRM